MASNVSTLETGLTNQSTVKVGVVSVKVGVARPKNFRALMRAELTTNPV